MTRQGYGSGLVALVVDDEPAVCLVLQRVLEMDGFTVRVAESVAAAGSLREEGPVDLVLADKNLPDGSGLDLVSEVGGGDTEVIIMTAYADVETAMTALRLKVADFLVKPFENLDELRARVRRAVENLTLRRQNRSLVGQLEEKNARLENLVVRDGLTGLFNHAYFQQRLECEIARCERGGHQLGVLFIDFDKFKQINDSLGHQAGDSVLREVAAQLRGEPSDGGGVREQDVAARYGGDEFVLLLPETTKAGAAITAERLRRRVAALRTGVGDACATVSIGVAAYPTDGSTREAVLHAADVAVYAAKRQGRDRVVSYTSALEGSHRPRDAAAGDNRLIALERTLAERAFRFVYQPIVDAASLRVFGYEALCRPTDRGMRDVVELLSAAAQAGKMVELGRMLRQLAVSSLETLAAPTRLFLNLHPQELTDPELFALELSRPCAERLVLELSEEVAVGDYGQARRVVRDLREQGFGIALDDVGAGNAGLHALAQIEADFIKLDRSLVRNLAVDGRTARLCKHVLEYAASEGVVVVAEGVETEAELVAVRELGCPLLQGFLLGAPQPTFRPADLAPANGDVPRPTVAIARPHFVDLG